VESPPVGDESVDDVVGHDPSCRPALVVDDHDGAAPVVDQPLDDLVERSVGLDDDGPGRGDEASDRVVGSGEEEFEDADVVDQAAIGVDDEDGVDLVAVFRLAP
jgi:hypothetical protein